MQSTDNIKWDYSTDIIVIGSGFAGLSAAIEAHNNGAKVLVIEKMKAPGGNSVISDGGIAACCTEEQRKAGIKDSTELFYSDMMRAGLGINNPDLVRTVVNNSKEAYEWSRDYLKVPYMDRIDIFGGHSVARCFTADKITGLTIIKKQMEKIRELGIDIRFSCCFKSFIKNNRGRIEGIKAEEEYDYKGESSGEIKNYKAEKAVILAAGGFGSDVEFRSAQDPRLTENISATTQVFSNAQPLIEALKTGAAPVQLSHIQTGPWASPDEKGYGDGPAFSEYIVFQYGLVVDPETGRRFVNELADRKTLSDAILDKEHPCIGIADSAAVEIAGWDINKCLEKGIVKKFNSIKELASEYSINFPELEKSLKRFNKSIENENDSEYGKPFLENAPVLAQAPWLAIRLWPKVHHTMGGVRIDANTHVLDLNGRIIQGLYAAGEITGGVHGACRLGSCAITECFVFGRIAGKNSAEE